MKKLLSITVITAVLLSSGIVFARSSAITNTHTTAIAQQHQGQIQGVNGSGNSTLSNSGNSTISDSGNASVGFNNSFNGSKPIRYTPVPTDVMFGNMPSMFSSPHSNKGINFIPAKSMIDMVSEWNVLQLKDADFDTDDVDVDLTIINESTVINDSNIVSFCIQGSDVDVELKAKGYKPIAIGTISTEDVDVNSPELYMTLVHKAKELNAHNVVLMTEGVRLELESSGWGIGASYNYASVNSDAHGQGSVGAGGTGYSKGKAKYNKLPYLTFTFVE